MTDKPMPEAYGFWHVTTEGDCEGRTTRDLGTHEGFFDEVAFALGDKAYYGLRLDKVNPNTLDKKAPKTIEVQVSMDIGTGTWDLNGKERVTYFKKMLAGREVHVEEGQYYACVKLVRGGSPEARDRARREALIASAQSKLTAEEKEALGLR
jgi:hypothetical protein